jgi:chromosomal replication initiation ATPase DnaA
MTPDGRGAPNVTDKFRQLALDLPTEPRFGREDFLVSPSNQTAFETFERWPDWHDPMLLLLGPTGAGKSHLASIWAHRANARALKAADLFCTDMPTLAASNAVLIEDADAIRSAENEIFHLINILRANGGTLVMTARSWPDSWGVALPDLLSRLRMAPAVEIAEPDDALVRAVLVKLFVDRQLRIDTTVVEYLAVRIERSLDSARAIVEALDREALERGRAVTRPMAADVLKRLEQSS